MKSELFQRGAGRWTSVIENLLLVVVLGLLLLAAVVMYQHGLI
jgi:hypothetical protein